MTQSLEPTEERCQELEANLAEVRAAVDRAAQDAGRDPAEVTIVAVSKRFPASDVLVLAQAGQRDFGESYLQEAQAKQQELWDEELNWHFVGRVQTKKAKDVAGAFGLVHSVDSRKLAQALHNRAQSRGVTQRILLQVSLAGEAQKGGAAREDAPGLIREILEMDHLELAGLMTMPPFFDDPEGARQYFKALRSLRDDLESGLGIPLPQLSMGMTGDFVQAVAEGATLVRIGTRIFGRRPP